MSMQSKRPQLSLNAPFGGKEPSLTAAQQTVLASLTCEPQLIGSLSCWGPAIGNILLMLARNGLVVLFAHDMPWAAPKHSIVTPSHVYHAACLTARGASLLS
jgi:hypothetical protein